MSSKQILNKLFPAVYGLLVYATIRLLQDTDSGFRFWERPLKTTLAEIALCPLVGYLLLSVIRLIFRHYDKKITAGKLPSGILQQELITVIIATVAIENLTLIPFTALTDDGLSWSDVVCINIVPLLYTVIYYAVIRSRILLKAYMQHQLLVEKLTNDQLQTELSFLKSQYHPHFLFNALNTIYFQMDEDVASAKQSVEKLSELLRYQLYDQNQMVKIGQELEYMKSFIQFQKVRSTNRLKLAVDIDKNLNDQYIYPLLFLPLVENAFKYAGGDYTINIQAKNSDGEFHFKVENSVPKNVNIEPKPGGIGLENLKRRLHLLYPQKHSLSVAMEGSSFIAELELIL